MERKRQSRFIVCAWVISLISYVGDLVLPGHGAERIPAERARAGEVRTATERAEHGARVTLALSDWRIVERRVLGTNMTAASPWIARARRRGDSSR